MFGERDSWADFPGCQTIISIDVRVKYLFSRPLGGGGDTQVCKWPKYIYFRFGLHVRQCSLYLHSSQYIFLAFSTLLPLLSKPGGGNRSVHCYIFVHLVCPPFFTTCFLAFSPLSSIGFCAVSSGFLRFRTFSILIFIQEFYLSPSFSEPFCTISSRCYHIFLHFHCIFPACLLHRHGLRLAFAPVSFIFQRIFHGFFLAFAPFSSVFQGILCDYLWSFHCIFPIHPHGFSGHQKGGPRGNRYPTVSKLPSGT